MGGVRMSDPQGGKHAMILDQIRNAGAKGITTGEIATALGIKRETSIRSALMALDPIYEEEVPLVEKSGRCRGRTVRYFWCGKEASNG